MAAPPKTLATAPTANATTSAAAPSTSTTTSTSLSAAELTQLNRLGDTSWGAMNKMNAELLAMTYGAVVVQLIRDFHDVKTVNAELEKMGFRIGTRLADEFLCKSGVTACRSFVETAEMVARVGFRMFLGQAAEVARWSPDGTAFSLVYRDCPLNLFVQLPQQYLGLDYDNLLCGVVRGALNAVQIVVECTVARAELKGANETEIRVVLKEVLREQYHDDEV